MANCVEQSFFDHVRYLRKKDQRFAQKIFSYGRTRLERLAEQEYRWRKRSTHEGRLDVFTEASVAPWIVWGMAQVYGLRVRMQHRFLTKLDYMHLEAAQNGIRFFVASNSDYGEEVRTIDLAPAIYCVSNWRHAQFMTSVPTGCDVRFAMQLYLPRGAK